MDTAPLITKGPGRNPAAPAAALGFAQQCAAGIVSALEGARYYILSPYRLGHQYLGFDWSDGRGNGVPITFCVAGVTSLPCHDIGQAGADVDVVDMVDALLLCQAIVKLVPGAQPMPIDHLSVS